MKKFEHLFSCDPMGAFEKIEDDYARYFEHAFKVKNEAVDEERMNTLKEGVNMSKKPYIELLPEYASVKGIGKGEEGMKSFGAWAESYIEYLVWYVKDNTLTEQGFDEDDSNTIQIFHCCNYD